MTADIKSVIIMFVTVFEIDNQADAVVMFFFCSINVAKL